MKKAQIVSISLCLLSSLVLPTSAYAEGLTSFVLRKCRDYIETHIMDKASTMLESIAQDRARGKVERSYNNWLRSEIDKNIDYFKNRESPTQSRVDYFLHKKIANDYDSTVMAWPWYCDREDHSPVITLFSPAADFVISTKDAVDIKYQETGREGETIYDWYSRVVLEKAEVKAFDWLPDPDSVEQDESSGDRGPETGSSKWIEYTGDPAGGYLVGGAPKYRLIDNPTATSTGPCETGDGTGGTSGSGQKKSDTPGVRIESITVERGGVSTGDRGDFDERFIYPEDDAGTTETSSSSYGLSLPPEAEGKKIYTSPDGKQRYWFNEDGSIGWVGAGPPPSTYLGAEAGQSKDEEDGEDTTGGDTKAKSKLKSIDKKRKHTLSKDPKKTKKIKPERAHGGASCP